MVLLSKFVTELGEGDWRGKPHGQGLIYFTSTCATSRPPAEKISSKIHSLNSTVPKGAYHIGKPCDVEKRDVVVCTRCLN